MTHGGARLERDQPVLGRERARHDQQLRDAHLERREARRPHRRAGDRPAPDRPARRSPRRRSASSSSSTAARTRGEGDLIERLINRAVLKVWDKLPHARGAASASSSTSSPGWGVEVSDRMRADEYQEGSGRSRACATPSRGSSDPSRARACSRPRPSSCSRASTSTRSSTGTAKAAGRATAPDASRGHAAGPLHRLGRHAAGPARPPTGSSTSSASYLSYTDDVQQALDWLAASGPRLGRHPRHGASTTSSSELRNAMRERMQDVHLRDAFTELRERLEDIARPGARRARPGGRTTRARAREARAARPAAARGCPRRSTRFATTTFESADARAWRSRTCSTTLDDIKRPRGLPAPLRRAPARPEAGSRSTRPSTSCARWSAGSALEDALLSGQLDAIDPDDAARAPRRRRGAEPPAPAERDRDARERGLRHAARGPHARSRRSGVRKLGQLALRDIYQGLLRDRSGGHSSDHRGVDPAPARRDAAVRASATRSSSTSSPTLRTRSRAAA